jgi:hypothetical protein
MADERPDWSDLLGRMCTRAEHHAAAVWGGLETKTRASSNPITQQRLERKDADDDEAIREAVRAAADCDDPACLQGRKTIGAWHIRQHTKARDDDEERDDLGRFLRTKSWGQTAFEAKLSVERGRFERPSLTRQEIETKLAEMAAYKAKYT